MPLSVRPQFHLYLLPGQGGQSLSDYPVRREAWTSGSKSTKTLIYHRVVAAGAGLRKAHVMPRCDMAMTCQCHAPRGRFRQCHDTGNVMTCHHVSDPPPRSCA